MKDDQISPDKGKLDRAKSMLTSSFSRMQQSVIGGSADNKKVTNLIIPNLKIIEKDQYKKQKECQICFMEFGKLTRQHHCRICANAVCSACSYSTINKERACDRCAYHYSDLGRQKFKEDVIKQLKNIAIKELGHKRMVEDEIKKIQEQIPSQERMQLQKLKHEQKMKKLNERLQQIQNQRGRLQQEINQLKEGLN